MASPRLLDARHHCPHDNGLHLTIVQEALRRIPNHKSKRPDDVACLVLNKLSLEFHETLHHPFQALAITGIILPAWLHNHTTFL